MTTGTENVSGEVATQAGIRKAEITSFKNESGTITLGFKDPDALANQTDRWRLASGLVEQTP